MSELAVFPKPFLRNTKQECRALMPNNVSYSQGVNQQIFIMDLGGAHSHTCPFHQPHQGGSSQDTHEDSKGKAFRPQARQES